MSKRWIETEAVETDLPALGLPAVGGSRRAPCSAGPNPSSNRSPITLSSRRRVCWPDGSWRNGRSGVGRVERANPEFFVDVGRPLFATLLTHWRRWLVGGAMLSRLGLLGAWCSACAPANKVLPNVKGPAEELPMEEVYFPLRDGHLYQYNVVGQDGRTAFLITKVNRQGESATLASGDRVQHLTIRTDGVYNESGYYIVKSPMAHGLEWSGQSGVVRVVEVGQIVETGAGKFTDCIVTREVTQGTVEIRTVETTFCPYVGLVKLNVRAAADQVTQVEEATLQYYGPPIDVDAM